MIIKLIIFYSLIYFSVSVKAVIEVVHAVNCGGREHVDINGIAYEKDPLSYGIASSHGRSLNIRKVDIFDQILYQTERYNTKHFEYVFPFKSEGPHVLVLKFCEVWFRQAKEKV